jgi:hypothetical protein
MYLGPGSLNANNISFQAGEGNGNPKHRNYEETLTELVNSLNEFRRYEKTNRLDINQPEIKE